LSSYQYQWGGIQYLLMQERTGNTGSAAGADERKFASLLDIMKKIS
jgi:hypothetical protein